MFLVVGVVFAATVGGGVPMVLDIALSGARFGALMGVVLVLTYLVIGLTGRRT